jgi:hypothetical protein
MIFYLLFWQRLIGDKVYRYIRRTMNDNDKAEMWMILCIASVLLLVSLGVNHYYESQMKDNIEEDFYFEPTGNGCVLYTDEDIGSISDEFIENAPNSVYDRKILIYKGEGFVRTFNYYDGDINLIIYEGGEVTFSGRGDTYSFDC